MKQRKHLFISLLNMTNMNTPTGPLISIQKMFIRSWAWSGIYSAIKAPCARAVRVRVCKENTTRPVASVPWLFSTNSSRQRVSHTPHRSDPTGLSPAPRENNHPGHPPPPPNSGPASLCRVLGDPAAVRGRTAQD